VLKYTWEWQVLVMWRRQIF